MRRGGEQDRVGQRARQARLVAVREHVAADVEQHDEVEPRCVAAAATPAAAPAGPPLGSTSTRRRAEQLGHAGLGEAEAAGPVVSGPRERGGGVQELGVVDLGERRGPGQRVDRPALPGQPADDRGRAEALGDGGRRERTGDVTAAADPDDEDARGVASRALGGGGGGRRGQTSAGTRAPQIDSISSRTRSNSSSERTGVPSNGRSRAISSHERQPPIVVADLTVTGRGMR